MPVLASTIASKLNLSYHTLYMHFVLHGESNVGQASPRMTRITTPTEAQTNHKLPLPNSPRTTLQSVHLPSDKPPSNKLSLPMNTEDAIHKHNVNYLHLLLQHPLPCILCRCGWDVLSSACISTVSSEIRWTTFSTLLNHLSINDHMQQLQL